MPKRRLITIVLFAVCIGLGVYLAKFFHREIKKDEQIVKTEKEVIEKLKIIQAAQIAHLAAKGEYAGNWPQLKKFLKEDKFVVTEKKEETVGAYDSIRVEIDTLFTIAVRDSLFPKEKYPGLNIEELETIPGSDTIFSIFADKIEQEGVMVDVFEVKDTKPVNPKRITGEHPKGPLRIGSRTEPKTTGNWK